MNELALFAGAGGGILGGHLLGWRTVCAVEWEPYPACVLVARQNEKILSPFPIWNDVQTFDGKPWAGIVDVVSGGFPCQDISSAGKGAGIDGERSGMWKQMARIIGEIQPKYAFVENSPILTSRGLGTVLGDLASLGFDAEWGVLSAADVGANHLRERMWIMAYAKGTRTSKNIGGLRQGAERIGRGQNTDTKMANTRCKLWNKGDTRNMVTNKTKWSTSTIHNKPSGKGQISNATSKRQQGQGQYVKPICEAKIRDWETSIFGPISKQNFWEIEPNVGRVANGVAAGMDRLKAIGNGQVPLCAATAWRLLNERL